MTNLDILSPMQKAPHGYRTVSELAAQSSTQTVVVDVSQWMNASFMLTYDAAFAGTLLAYGSLSTNAPTVTSSLSQANEFFPLATARHDTAAIVAGATGYTVAAASIGVISADFQYNTIKWLAVTVTCSTGTFDFTLMVSNNS